MPEPTTARQRMLDIAHAGATDPDFAGLGAADKFVNSLADDERSGLLHQLVSTKVEQMIEASPGYGILYEAPELCNRVTEMILEEIRRQSAAGSSDVARDALMWVVAERLDQISKSKRSLDRLTDGDTSALENH